MLKIEDDEIRDVEHLAMQRSRLRWVLRERIKCFQPLISINMKNPCCCLTRDRNVSKMVFLGKVESLRKI